MQHYQLELEQREQRAIEITAELEKINRKLAKLRLDKEELELELIATIGHEHIGSKTYDVGERSVTLKTEMIYALDKKAYCSGDVFLPAEFDPILQKVTYEVNKKLFNHYESIAPASVRETLNMLVTKKNSKPAVSIKVRA
jgi:hypothetical protein